MPGDLKIQFAKNVPFRVPIPSVPTVPRSMVQWPVIKDVWLIWHPLAVWNRLAHEPRRLSHVFWNNFLPVMLMASVAEGISLLRLGRSNKPTVPDAINLPEAVSFELAQAIIVMLIVLFSAMVITMLANTCHRRNHIHESLVVLLHAMGPFYLLQTLNILPGMSPWLTWTAGVFCVLISLYLGIPRILQPDAPSAPGLFISSALILVLLLFSIRLVGSWFLIRQIHPLHNLYSLFAARY